MARQSPEQLLDTQETQSRNLQELNPNYLWNRFLQSWQRNHPEGTTPSDA